MATEIGTATDYQDLLSKLLAFLTTNSSLVSANQDWQVVDTVSSGGESDVLLKGQGLSQSDNIYVRLATVNNGSGRVGMSCWGFVAYNSTLDHSSQPGISSSVGMVLWNTNIEYWFIANGRRFMVIAKLSTQYMSLHAGFFLPYATPIQYPYPMYIGGSHANGTAVDYNTTSPQYSSFWNPGSSSGYVYTPAGNWVNIVSCTSSGQNTGYTNRMAPFGEGPTFAANPTAGVAWFPIVPLYTGPLGALDGVYASLSTGVAAEDDSVFDSYTHIVFPSNYKTDINSYAALRLS